MKTSPTLKNSFSIFFLTAALFFLPALAPAGAAAEITRLIPKSAPAFLLVDFSRNDLSPRLAKLAVKIAAAKPASADPLAEAVGFAYDNPEFLKTVSSVAVVYLESDPSKNATEKYVPVSFIIKPADRKGFEKAVAAMKEKLLKGPGEYSAASETQGSLEIEILKEKNGKGAVAFFSHEDYFVLGVGTETAVDSVKAVSACIADGAGIDSARPFIEAVKAVPLSANLYFYLDGIYVRKYAENQKLPEKIDFINSFCFAADAAGNSLNLKGAFVTDVKNQANAFTKYFTADGRPLVSPSMLDTDQIVFVGARFAFDAAAFMGDKASGDIRSRISNDLGLDLENDITDWIGDELFASFANYRIAPLPVLPSPGFYLGLKTRNASSCEKCLKKMTAVLKKFDETKAGNVTVYHRPVETPGNILPDFGITFAIVNDFLIATTSKDAVSTLIASVDRKTGHLESDPDFQSAAGSLAAGSIFSFFYNGAIGSEFLCALAKMGNKNLGEKELRVLKVVRTAGGGFNMASGSLGFETRIAFDPVQLVEFLKAASVNNDALETQKK